MEDLCVQLTLSWSAKDNFQDSQGMLETTGGTEPCLFYVTLYIHTRLYKT